MAPSTSTPTAHHRAPVACLQCRSAKVRCLFAQSAEQCDRCRANDTTCVFTQPMRSRSAVGKQARRSRLAQADTSQRRGSGRHRRPQDSVPGPLPDSTISVLEVHAGSVSSSAVPLSPHPEPQPDDGDAPRSSISNNDRRHVTENLESVNCSTPPITDSMRRRIVSTLATLNGKRGAPFSLITPGEQAFKPGSLAERGQPRSSQSSLKLSHLLRPLRARSDSRRQSQEALQKLPVPVKMPSYSDSVSLCQTIKDPVEGGLIPKETSEAFFQFFMQELNAKWEYILDPCADTHDDVRRRSPFLLAAILFCASKFVSFANGNLTQKTDAFIQSRLCSLARSLAIDTFARGDRSVEAMQAYYLLVCWKDADDDISYMHSGYSIQILRDMDLDQVDGDEKRRARAMRAYIALFRQDKQQSLFFMRRSSFSNGNSPEVSTLRRWLKMPHTTSLDTIACCSADIRRIQSKLREMASTSSPQMLPCLSDLLHTELDNWRSAWHDDLQLAISPQQSNEQMASLYPEKAHVMRIIGLWESSVKLGVATEILRRSLLDSLATSTTLDVLTVGNILTSDTPGLMSSVEGALDTLRYLLQFPCHDLRRSPDACLLLGPHASLYLVVVLGCPANGPIGPSFQSIAIDMIGKVTQHFAASVVSPEDSIALHSTYLESLVNLLKPQGVMMDDPRPDLELLSRSNNLETGAVHEDLDSTTLQAAQVLANGIGSRVSDWETTNSWFSSMETGSIPDLELQSLANLVETNAFWDQWVAPGDMTMI